VAAETAWIGRRYRIEAEQALETKEVKTEELRPEQLDKISGANYGGGIRPQRIRLGVWKLDAKPIASIRTRR
jgi:hypothetical protein